MDWVGVIVIVAVLLVGTVGGLVRRRRDGHFRDVSTARKRIAQLAGDAEVPTLRRSAPEAAASAAAAASQATAAAAASQASAAGFHATAAAAGFHATAAAAGFHATAAAGGFRATAAPGDSQATAAAVSTGESPPTRALRLVKDSGEADGQVVPDAREEPGVVAEEPAATGDDRLDHDLLDRLGVGSAQATLLQFSSAFCAPCRAVRRISAEVAALLPGVQHVEVDAESHLAEVRELGIWRTPTLLLLDAEGRVVKRATGVPSKPQLIAALADVLPGG